MSEETPLPTVAKAPRKRAPKKEAPATEPATTPPSPTVKAVPVPESEVARAVKATAQPPGRAYLDRYDVVEIHRTQIKNAPYNPRIMSDAARKNLSKIIEKIGNLGPPNWNRRSGNIIGGHQRFKVFDDFYGTKNYTIRVAAVDLDEKQEIEANLALNNRLAQGDDDFEKLGDLFKTDIDFEACGYDSASVFKMFGEDVLAGRKDGGEKLLKLGEELAENQQRIKREVESMAAKRDDSQFFLVFVFRDTAELDGVLGRFSLPNEQWQSGDDLVAALDKAAKWDALQAKKGGRRKPSAIEAEDEDGEEPDASSIEDDEDE